MDGIKKTALFLSGLEYSMVDQLLGRLDSESARMVRREMMSLHHNAVSVQESHRLDNEFLQKAGWKRKKTVAAPKYQFARTATTYMPPKRKPVRFDVESFIPKSRPFDFLRNWDTEDIVREIIEEHPQTIAIVLAHLPRSRTGDVLTQLPPSLKNDVTERLAHFEPTNEELLYEIETALKKRERLPSQTPSLTFDDLSRLSNSNLSTLFHSVDARTAMLSLIGANPLLIERVTERFSPTEEHQMRQLLKTIGHNINEDDVNRAKSVIMERAEHLL